MVARRHGPVSLVAFDVGNTTVKCAVRRDAGWEVLLRVATLPAESLAQRLREALGDGPAQGADGVRSVACSVRPDADEGLAAFWRDVSATPVEFFGRDLQVPIETLVDEPARVGTDRLLLALGARQTCGAPCVIVSAGTAITIDLVDAEGRFAGGAIAPGFHLAARALHGQTAMLPLVEPTEPPPDDSTPGRNTAEALRQGIYWFCAGGVRALISRYTRAAAAPVVCTGTDAPLLLPALRDRQVHHEPDLIFKGMAAALDPPSGLR